MTASLIALAKAILVASVATCVLPDHENPSEVEPPSGLDEKNGQHFCCATVSTNGSGTGCITIDKTHVPGCDKLLYCGVSYVKDGGDVTCIN